MSNRAPYSHELYALAKHVVFRAENEHKAFSRCKFENKDRNVAEACRAEGEALVRATNALYTEVMKTHPDEFKEFAKCLDWYGLRFSRCRDKQAAFEAVYPITPPEEKK